MANNLRVFNLISDYNEAGLVKPSVSFVVENGKVYYDDVPSPIFQGKWLATYYDSHTESAECGSSSAITKNEIYLSNLVSVEIGDCVTSIGNHVFQSCSGLTSIDIPNSVTSIGSYVFQNCRSLTSCTIGNSVTSIGDAAFADCGSLRSIDIPSGVTSIGDLAFSSCSSLTSITVNATTPPTLGNYAFANTNNCPIYVPSQSLTAYKTAEEWRYFASRIYPIS